MSRRALLALQMGGISFVLVADVLVDFLARHEFRGLPNPPRFRKRARIFDRHFLLDVTASGRR